MWWIIGAIAVVLGIVAVAWAQARRVEQKAQDEQHYAEPEQDDEPEEEPRTIAEADPVKPWDVPCAVTEDYAGGEIYRAPQRRRATFTEETPFTTVDPDFNFDGIPDLLEQPAFSPGLEPVYEVPAPAYEYCEPRPESFESTPNPSYDPTPAPAPDNCPAPAPDPTPAPAPDYGSSGSSYDSGSSSSYDNGSSGW